MGTKRRKGDEVSSTVFSLSCVSTDRASPAKAPRTTTALAPRRFGFKGPLISQLPTPAPASTRTTRPVTNTVDSTHGSATATDAGENGILSTDRDVQVLKTFDKSFGQETLTTLEQLLAFRPKTNKFAVKARKEEQITYIKQLKSSVREVVHKVHTMN